MAAVHVAQVVDARIADLETIRTHLVAAIDAGCEDLHVCATSDCCPLPFMEIADRHGNE